MKDTNVYYVGGSKGGVGKSLFAFALVDYLLERGQNILLVDTDTDNPDVHKAHVSLGLPNLQCRMNSLDDADGWADLLDTVQEYSDHAVVINAAARTKTSTTSYGEIMKSALEEMGRELVVFWIINRHRDSVELLHSFMEAFPETTIHVCRNLYFGEASRFDIYNNSRAKSAIKHLERMRGSKVIREEEYHRLTMMQQALNLQDDDAVWMLFLAMEYQKAYYEQLPKKISDTTSELLKRVRETADSEAANAQNRLIQSVIGQTEKLTARVHIVPLMPIYLLIILCLMAFGSVTYWAGLCAGLGKPLPMENVYYVPAGCVLVGIGVTTSLFCLGVLIWKIFFMRTTGHSY